MAIRHQTNTQKAQAQAHAQITHTRIAQIIIENCCVDLPFILLLLKHYVPYII